MPRVHCLECDGLVVVDPSGVCPEGHQLGPAGARVAEAMGHGTAHPDEPEPWIYRIEPHELAVAVGAGVNGAEVNGDAPHVAGSNGNGPRVARPMSAPGFDPFDDTAEVGHAESLLRELHSLADVNDAPAPRPQHAGSQRAREEDAPVAAPSSPPPSPSSHTPRPARPHPDAIADAFAELSALDAPAAPMTARSRSGAAARQNGVASSANGRSGTSRHNGTEPEMDPDELASLFDTPPPTTEASAPPDLATAPTPSAAPPTPSRDTAALDRSDHPEEPDLPDQPDLPDLPDLPDMLDLPDLPDMLDVLDRSDPPDQPDHSSVAPATPAAGPPQPDPAPRDATAPTMPPPQSDHHQETPVPATPTADEPEGLGDLDMDLAELAKELSFGGDEPPFGEPAPDPAAAPGTAPSPPAATAQPAPSPPAPPQIDPGSLSDAPGAEPENDLRQPDPPRNAGPDLASFTAKGGSGARSGKRRRFGR